MILIADAAALAVAPTVEEETMAAAEMKVASDAASPATSRSTALTAQEEAALAVEDLLLDTVAEPTETEATVAEEKREDTLVPATESTEEEDRTAEVTHPTPRDDQVH